MLQVKAIVKPSGIHGLGLFAGKHLMPGELVWKYDEGDSRMPVTLAPPKVLDRGYINPRKPSFVVICGDNAQFINFRNGAPANLREIVGNGESDLVANRRIELGEELTIEPATDADYERK